MTDEEKNEIINAIKAESVDVNDLEKVEALDDAISLPAVQNGKVVTVPIGLLSQPAKEAAENANAVAEHAAEEANNATEAAILAKTAAEEAQSVSSVFESELEKEISDRQIADTENKNLIEGDPETVKNNIRNPFTYLGNFDTWTEIQAELDKLHSQGEDNTKVGEFRMQLNNRNLIVRNFVQNWATGVFTQTVQGSIQWNTETQTMDQSLNINTYERHYNEGTGWTTWEEGTARIELAQELSTEDGSENKAISQKAVGEAVDEINNGESAAAEQIEIGDIEDNKFLNNSGILASITGRAVSDYIDIEKYAGKELTLLRGGTWRDSNSYCIYDADKRFVSRSLTKAVYLKFSVDKNAKYIRVSCTSANINKMQLWYEGVNKLGLVDVSKDVVTLQNDLNSVLEAEQSFWPNEEKNFITDGSGGILSQDFYIKIPGKHYTKFKFYAYNTAVNTLWAYALNKDLGFYLPIYSVGFTASEEEVGSVVERDIDLNAIGYDEIFVVATLSRYKSSSTLNPGMELYKVSLSSLLTKEEVDTIEPYLNGRLHDLSFSLCYKTFAQQEDREVYLSEFFDRKDYVAYGDSISVIAQNDEGESNYAATYPARLAKYFNFNLVNKAASGSVPVASGTNNNNLTDANLEAVTGNTMLVTISGGQNKWVHDENINSTDRTTSIGAINYYIDKIREVSPTCIIVLCPTYIGNGDTQCAKDYKAIAENKHVGLAPTLDLTLIDWEGDKLVKKLRYDNIHPTVFGAGRFAAVCREYIKQFLF